MTTKEQAKSFANAANSKTFAKYLLPGGTWNNWPGRFFRSLLYIVGILLVGSQLTHATTWYVTQGGRDSNTCTRSKPCAKPDYVANNLARAGDTVSVAAGAYDYGRAALDVTNSGTATDYISIVCASRGNCKIKNGVSGNMAVVELAGRYLKFTGFEVTNYSSQGNNMGFYVTGSNIVINENTIHHIETDCSDVGGGGIQLEEFVANITMDSNLIYDIAWPTGGDPKCGKSVRQFDGIIAETNGAGIIITNNVVYHVSGGWGVLYGNPKDNMTNPVLIASNTIFSTSNGGIVLPRPSAGSFLIDNIILDTGVKSYQCGILYDSSVSYNWTHNDLYGNYGGNYCELWGSADQIGGPVQPTDISVNPSLGTTFVHWQSDGSGNYHEAAGSPTIGAGTENCGSKNPFPICAPTHDFDGNQRGINGVYDIGAYQNQSTLSMTTHSPLPDGTPGVAYSHQLTATGGKTPYTWSVTACSGACDADLGFTSGELLSGTPTNAGASTFTFKAKDANNNIATAKLSITINN